MTYSISARRNTSVTVSPFSTARCCAGSHSSSGARKARNGVTAIALRPCEATERHGGPHAEIPEGHLPTLRHGHRYTTVRLGVLKGVGVRRLEAVEACEGFGFGVCGEHLVFPSVCIYTVLARLYIQRKPAELQARIEAAL